MLEDKLYEKIQQLEKKKMEYLEVDNNAGARRISKQIENTQIQLELLKLNELKLELSVYKKVVVKYPGISSEVRNLLLEQKHMRKEK